MKKICTKCMAKPCMCLPVSESKWDFDAPSTEVYINVSSRSIIETEKALMVTLKKQKLSNGCQIPAGTTIWIPNGKICDITNGNRLISVPNWKLNELIRMYNIDKIKNSY